MKWLKCGQHNKVYGLVSEAIVLKIWAFSLLNCDTFHLLRYM